MNDRDLTGSKMARIGIRGDSKMVAIGISWVLRGARKGIIGTLRVPERESLT